MSDKRNEFMNAHSDEEKWFLADLEGNSLLPQTGLGIAIFVFNGLFESGMNLKTLERYATYDPSEKQIAKAELLMSSFHTSFGIDKDKNDFILKHGGINELFMSAKGLILNTLYLSLTNVMASDRSYEGEESVTTSLSNLEQLMTEDGYTIAREELSRLVKRAMQTIRAEANGICREYKDYIRDMNVRALAAKQAKRDGNFSETTFDVASTARESNSPLLKLEEKIIEDWLADETVSYIGRDRMRSLLNAIHGDQV